MNIKPAVQNIFGQISWLLEHVSNDEYARIIKNLNGSSIGQHVRHTLEFFKCLFEGIESGAINYDLRERNIFLENNTLEAQTLIDELQKKLAALDKDAPLNLVQTYDENTFEIKTNVTRELVYNVEHAVHHLALIRVALYEIKPTLKLDGSFGLASSTLRFRKSLPSQKINS